MNKNLNWIKIQFKKLYNGMDLERKETQHMVSIFYKMLSHKLNLNSTNDYPTDAEVKTAIHQLKDIPKLAPIVTILVASPIPGSGLYYIYLMKLIEKLTHNKIKILPESLSKELEEKKEE